MLNTLDLSDLVEPVIQRAQASEVSARVKGFSDCSAAVVLERLGINPRSDDYTSLSQTENENQIARCTWIDDQLRLFLDINPDAEGVEVNGGLSTRFHRLSEQLDWPRFSWSAINTFDVNECLEYVFPTLDNCKYFACHQPESDWGNFVNWQGEKRKIVIIGEQKPLHCRGEAVEICRSIEQVLTRETPCIDLILTHYIHGASAASESKKLPANAAIMQTYTEENRNIFNRLPGFLGVKTQQKTAMALHMQIVKN